MVNLLMAIQIVSYMPLYKVDFPASLELYINSLRKVAEFDILPTDELKDFLLKNGVISISSANKTAGDQIKEQEFSSAGFTSFNPIQNLFGFIFILAVFMILVLLLSVLALKKSIRDKVVDKLHAIKN